MLLHPSTKGTIPFVTQKSVLELLIWQNLWQTSELWFSSLTVLSFLPTLPFQWRSFHSTVHPSWSSMSASELRTEPSFSPEFFEVWKHWIRVHHKGTDKLNYRLWESLLLSPDCLSIIIKLHCSNFRILCLIWIKLSVRFWILLACLWNLLCDKGKCQELRCVDCNWLIFRPHGRMINTWWQHNEKVIMLLGHSGGNWNKQ